MHCINSVAGRSPEPRPFATLTSSRLLRGAGTLLLAGSVLQGGPSLAASSQGQASATIVPGLNAAMVGDLTFGTISPPETGTASVTVLLSGDDASTCGSGLTCFDVGNRARLQLAGAPQSRVSVSAPGAITLADGSGNFMTVDSFTFGDGGGAAQAFRMDALGAKTVFIGATLHIPTGQPAGAYSGTYTVTASYE